PLIRIGVIDMEGVELARRTVTLELARCDAGDARLAKQVGHDLMVLRPHVLLDAVGAKALDLAAYEQASLVNGVAKGVTRIAKHEQIAGLPHECRHVADTALHDDVDTLHRDAAARGRIAADDEKAAAPGRTGILPRIALDDDLTRHHVFRDARTG